MCNIIGDLACMFSTGLSVAVGGGRYLHGPSHWVHSELSLIKVATHQKEVYYRLVIWHLHFILKTNTW